MPTVKRYLKVLLLHLRCCPKTAVLLRFLLLTTLAGDLSWVAG